MKKVCVVTVMLAFLLAMGCGTVNATDEMTSSEQKNDIVVSSAEIVADNEKADVIFAPSTDDELFDYFLDSWRNQSVNNLYEYCSGDIKGMLNEDAFETTLLDVFDVFSDILDVTNKYSVEEAGMTKYTCDAVFSNAKALLEVYISNMSIVGFKFDMDFCNPFTYSLSGGISEEYFSIESDGRKLNAVYTDSGKVNAPQVLLIPGSGKSDYNETNGLLVPFEELARGLAARGINSLRMEKRTERYGEEWRESDGLGEEYFYDFGKAYEWLRDNKEGGIYVIGHSLGANIAVEMAANYGAEGVVCINGSLRHLADILCDQYIAVDSANADTYRAYADYSKKVTESSAQGIYLFGVTDSYWAEYNKLSMVDSLRENQINTLAINGTSDSQLFSIDYDYLDEYSENNSFFQIKYLDDVNHYGYIGNILSESDIYAPFSFSNEMVDCISEFITK